MIDRSDGTMEPPTKVSVMVLPATEREFTVGAPSTTPLYSSAAADVYKRQASSIVRTIVLEVVAVESTVGAVTSRVLSIARFVKLAREFAGVAVSSIVPDTWV